MSTDPQIFPQGAGRPDGVGVSAVIVLAAGGGTRMKSRTSKLLHRVAGRPLLSYAVQAAGSLEPDRLVVVVGHEREQVQAHLAEFAPEVSIAVQEHQNGTGDAVRAGLSVLPDDLDGVVVVTYGDVPMLSGATSTEFEPMKTSSPRCDVDLWAPS